MGDPIDPGACREQRSFRGPPGLGGNDARAARAVLDTTLRLLCCCHGLLRGTTSPDS
jgi:hypothetical protein